MKWKFSFILVCVLTDNCIAQQDTLADVFPLSIGNKWTYGFYTNIYSSMAHFSVTDTGFVEYQVIGSINSSDSIRWQFIQRRNFTETIYLSGTHVIKDSSNFEIVELTQGRHELYTPIFDALACFPFKKFYVDSLHIFRYIVVDSINQATLIMNYLDINTVNYYTFLLKKNIGVFRTIGGYVIFGIGDHPQARYYLQSFKSSDTIFTNVQTEQPEVFFLSQNYPNPFNPTTTISFSIGHSSFVSLKVCDVLGREVSTLVNEKLKPGSYKRLFSGMGLPSGVYLYRLRSDNFMQTKKFILLK